MKKKLWSCVLPENYPKKEYANKKAKILNVRFCLIKKPETVNVLMMLLQKV